MEYAGMSQQEFAVKLEVSPASLSSIYTGRTNPTNNHVMAIHRAFPEIDINWLLFGEGQMCTNSSSRPAGNEGAENTGLESGGGNAALSSVKNPPSIFSEEDFTVQGRHGVAASTHPVGQRENPLPTPLPGYTMQGTKIIDKKERKIKEIRVFFDDGTYESFVPSSK